MCVLGVRGGGAAIISKCVDVDLRPVQDYPGNHRVATEYAIYCIGSNECSKMDFLIPPPAFFFLLAFRDVFDLSS